MIGSVVLGASIFLILGSMYSVALDVLIKILEGLSTSNPNIHMINVIYQERREERKRFLQGLHRHLDL